jgi:hypothetical protein
MKNKLHVILSLGSLAMGSFLSAQGGFVLFGESAEVIKPEHKVVRPLTAPYFHEDSFITTDLRAWYLQHDFGSDTVGGDLTVAALQVRVALTERLQFVAYKDGYSNFDNAAVVGGADGLNDIGAGLKWAFLQDWERQLHGALGIGYELGLGDDEVLQKTDELRVWVNKGFDRLHLGATVNYIVANDNDANALGNADLMTAHLHTDYYVNQWLSPVLEINGYFVQDDGAVALPFSGVDAVSIGGGANEDVVTGALGLELRPLEANLGMRVAYETQLTDNVSLFGHRWTLSAVYEF